MLQLVDPKTLPDNVFSLLDDQWTLITAGDANRCNTMTASWGGLGVLFNKPVATIYVRPQRYTFQFLEEQPCFTLSFLPEQYREALALCGSVSGRDTDKIKETGLTLAMAHDHAPYFEEARLVLVCRKLYWDDLDPAHFTDPALEEFYPQRDYHRLYLGEITQALVQG